MSDHYLMTYLDHEYQRLIRHRETIRSSVQEEIRAIERDLGVMRGLIQQMKHDRLHETTVKPVKPLTPVQAAKRAESNRKRQQRIKDIQAAANERIATVRARIGK